MRDPERLLSSDTSGLERLLLATAAHERPSPALRFRMRHALGLPALVATATAKATFVAWGQTAVTVVVAAGLLVTASSPVRTTSFAPAEPMGARASVEARHAGPQPASVQQAAPAEEQVTEPPVALSLRKVGRNSPRATQPPEPGPPPVKAVTPSEVHEEIQLLDEVRIALRAGRSEHALGRVATYDGRFPRGVFRQEATVLRIQAMQQSGNSSQAARLASEFVARHPESPHAKRVIGAVNSAEGTR